MAWSEISCEARLCVLSWMSVLLLLPMPMPRKLDLVWLWVWLRWV
ncbi:MAG: hypothetical protein RJA98_1165, partial [Pseudomonadota bacterium]